jgi:putative multiple sugar transport system permease protein
MSAQKQGYELAPLPGELAKMVVISIIVLWIFFKLANYKGIPTMLIWVAIVLLAYTYITSNTRMGRYLYAVGGNEKATKLSGIDTRKVYFLAYLSMSFLAGLSGLLMAARIASVNGDTGNAFEMDAIGSCFIGGASAYGGVGTVPGVIIGALLMGVINIGMSIMGVDANYQKVVKGLVLLAAVIFDVISKKKNS